MEGPHGFLLMQGLRKLSWHTYCSEFKFVSLGLMWWLVVTSSEYLLWACNKKYDYGHVLGQDPTEFLNLHILFENKRPRL